MYRYVQERGVVLGERVWSLVPVLAQVCIKHNFWGSLVLKVRHLLVGGAAICMICLNRHW